MVKGEADAISMWEQSRRTRFARSARRHHLPGQQGLSRDVSVYSTTDVMNDPRRRKELVAFVRSTLVAARIFRRIRNATSR